MSIEYSQLNSFFKKTCPGTYSANSGQDFCITQEQELTSKTTKVVCKQVMVWCKTAKGQGLIFLLQIDVLKNYSG